MSIMKLPYIIFTRLECHDMLYNTTHILSKFVCGLKLQRNKANAYGDNYLYYKQLRYRCIKYMLMLYLLVCSVTNMGFGFLP